MTLFSNFSLWRCTDIFTYNNLDFGRYKRNACEIEFNITRVHNISEALTYFIEPSSMQ